MKPVSPFLVLTAIMSIWDGSVVQAQTDIKSAKASAETTYESCVALVDDNPAKALTEAQAWQANSSDSAQEPGAYHCEALALSALGRHAEAAQKFVELGDLIKDAPASDRAELCVQAAISFMAAHKMKQAEEIYGEAIELQPENTDYYMDRAQIRMLLKDWPGVRSDTGAVLAHLPNSVDALTLRATASRMMGHKEAALADAERAVSIAPHNLPALLERGLSLAASGFGDKARNDWENVIYFAQAMGRNGDPIIEEARSYLAGSR